MRCVAAIGDVHVALRVDGQRMRRVELIRLVPSDVAAHLADESAVLVELHDAMVDVSIGYEDVALRIPADIGGAGEQIALVGRRVALRSWNDGLDGLGPAAQHHHDFALRVELDDHVRPLVHGPHVVF